MSEVNWRSDDMAKAMLSLLDAIEKQDISVEDVEIVVNFKRSPNPAKYVGEYFGTVKVYERIV